jgi:hypothetical protein
VRSRLAYYHSKGSENLIREGHGVGSRNYWMGQPVEGGIEGGGQLGDRAGDFVSHLGEFIGGAVQFPARRLAPGAVARFVDSRHGIGE